MPAILFELDPTSEDAANVPVVLTDATWRVMEMDVSPPEIDPMYASSADTEGEPFVQGRHHNRTISLTLLAKTATDALTQTAVQGLMMKLDKQRREGGTLKWTTQAGTVVVADVLFAQVKSEITQELYVVNKAVKLMVDFVCKPYLRGSAVLQSDHVETTLPHLIFTETGLAGDVPGLGRLVIDEDQAINQSWVVWGLQSRYYDSSANAALFYEAETRTAMGGSATAAGPSGASGGGSNVMRNLVLGNSFLPIMSTQATGGGAHHQHVGSFRFIARVQTATANTGAVSLCLEWAAGDYRATTRNAAVTFPIDGYDNTWRLVDLGIVNLSRVTQGAQRWEGRILAKSTVSSDDIDVDCYWLIPIDEGSGEATAAPQTTTPSAMSARDEFDQTAGALTGKTLPVGGTWTFSHGNATDFTVDATNHYVTRATVSETGRWVYASTPSLTDMGVQIDHLGEPPGPSGSAYHYLIYRWVDASNYGIVRIERYGYTRGGHEGFNSTIVASKFIAGAETVLGTKDTNFSGWHTLLVTATAAGEVSVFDYPTGSVSGSAVITFKDTVFATAGTLATGKAGFGDANFTATAVTRYYDNFQIWTPAAADAAIYASQSLELRYDMVTREDSAGVLWARPGAYEGDYLLVPAAGKEGRTVRFLVKASRGAPGSAADGGIDDISARLTYTPRYLVLPS